VVHHHHENEPEVQKQEKKITVWFLTSGNTVKQSGTGILKKKPANILYTLLEEHWKVWVQNLAWHITRQKPDHTAWPLILWKKLAPSPQVCLQWWGLLKDSWRTPVLSSQVHHVAQLQLQPEPARLARCQQPYKFRSNWSDFDNIKQRFSELVVCQLADDWCLWPDTYLLLLYHTAAIMLFCAASDFSLLRSRDSTTITAKMIAWLAQSSYHSRSCVVCTDVTLQVSLS